MSRTTKGTRRSNLKVRKRGGLIARLFAWVRKFGFYAAIFIFFLWLCAWFFLSGAAISTWNWTKTSVIETAAEQGMRVENILIEGRNFTDSDLLFSIINTQRGDPLLDFDPEAVQPIIEQISWVKNAVVMRRLPDTIHVILEERMPYALWQKSANQVVVIDMDGEILTETLRPEFKSLMILSGEGAAKNAAKLIELLKAEPELFSMSEAALFIGQRRWDLKLKNGLSVQLPEYDTGFAISRLMKAAREDDLLNKDIQVIDLREPGRIIVEGN